MANLKSNLSMRPVRSIGTGSLDGAVKIASVAAVEALIPSYHTLDGDIDNGKEIPPDVLDPIAGGAKVGVRDHIRWIPASVSPSVSSVDTETTLSSLSSSDYEESSSDADSITSEQDRLPPSPPIRAISSSDSIPVDYFTQDKTSFLRRVFPQSKHLDRAIAVSSVNAQAWSLALLADDESRVLYAHGSLAQMNVRENLVQLLDMADEELECDQVVVVLEKNEAQFGTILHSLLYVGGVVLTPSSKSLHQAHSKNCVLVGIDL